MKTQIYHKKNELFEVEFFKDEECTEAFDLTNAKNLYIDGMKGDITPLCYLHYLIMDIPHSFVRNDIVSKKPNLGDIINIYTPYIPSFFDARPRKANLGCVKTLDDITPNLSKYIPKDNAVLFLSEEDRNQYDYNDNLKFRIVCQDSIIPDSWKLLADKSSEITIFLPHAKKSELQKANEVAKELMEKYEVEEVNLFALHCFTQQDYILNIYGNCLEDSCLADNVCNFNKIITTNSTGILPVQDNERLQVIDGKEIFKEYLKTENN